MHFFVFFDQLATNFKDSKIENIASNIFLIKIKKENIK